MARKKDEQPLNAADRRHARRVTATSAWMSAWVTQALVVAEPFGIGDKPLEHFWLSPDQRDVLRRVPGIKRTIKTRLAKGDSSFIVTEVASMTVAVVEDMPSSDGHKELALMLVAKHLMERLQDGIAEPAVPQQVKQNVPKAKTKVAILYQFKITLLGIKPPIWRRIQVWNCTLDKRHEHIQTAMGWTNSHLHQFKIGDKLYGDPLLMEDDFETIEYVDSTTTMLNNILPKSGKQLRFIYEYDFGDGWEHEVLFEGCPTPEPSKSYPSCLEGEHSCPPEDVGGVGSYAEFLEILADPKHEEHKRQRTWVGRSFDAEKFDAKQATKAMKKGLPDWRRMRQDGF